MPLLRVHSLSLRFGTLWALEDVSFRVEPGEVVGLVGRRGAGKSSLLAVIGGMAAPSGGEISFRGRTVQFRGVKDARNAGIELVTQSPKLLEKQDVVSNIFVGREICWPPRIGIPDNDRMYARARDLLADFDLPASMLPETPWDLSDELRQMVAIARALCKPPHLLLLDESLSALTFPRQQMLLGKIKALAAQGAGVLISSDNLNHLFSVTNRILVLYEGRLVANRITADCTPRDIVEMIVGSSSREQTTPVVWALESFHAAQRQTEELYRAQATLHQSLEASDSLNRQLVLRLSEQVKALDTLNSALQMTQRRLLTENEEKRKELARELHDEVIQDLLSVNYRLEEAEEMGSLGDVTAELAGVRESIRQLVSDLRQLCQDLRPPTIDNHGLPSAIRSLAQEWAERNGMHLELNIDAELGRIPETIELTAFRIVQEGLNNIRKHAAARNVSLTLYRTGMDNLLIRLVDDGRGISAPPDFTALTAGKHFGLLGISERVALFGGTMQLNSPPEGGLSLEIELPAPYPSV